MTDSKKILIEDTPWSEIGDRSPLSLNREACASSSKPTKKIVEKLNTSYYFKEYCKYEENRKTPEFQNSMKKLGLDPATWPNPHAESAGVLPPLPVQWMEERRKLNKEQGKK